MNKYRKKTNFELYGNEAKNFSSKWSFCLFYLNFPCFMFGVNFILNFIMNYLLACQNLLL